MVRRVSIQDRWKIIGLSQSGIRQKDIAAQIGCSIPTVIRIVRAYREEGRVRDARRGSRQRATTEDEDIAILASSSRDPFKTATDLKRELGLAASTSTIQRRLRGARLRSCAAARKTGLTEHHKAARLRFCQEHVHWTEAEWQEVVFSDESTFSSTCHQWCRVWRPPRSRFIPAYVLRIFCSGRHSVPVWGCISIHGLGPLVRVEGRFNGEAYEAVIEEHLVPYILDGPFPDGVFVYQHDGSSVHRAARVQSTLRTLCIRQLPWPAMSPDLNPIENVWAILKMRIQKLRIRIQTADQLWQIVSSEWHQLRREPSLTNNLYASVPRRIEAVIAADGDVTRY